MESIRNKNPLAALEDEYEEHIRKLERMEKEMEDVFNKKLAIKLKKIKDTEKRLTEDVDRDQRSLEKMKQELMSIREDYESEKSFAMFENLSPSHSDKSEASVTSSSSKKGFRFFDQIKKK